MLKFRTTTVCTEVSTVWSSHRVTDHLLHIVSSGVSTLEREKKKNGQKSDKHYDKSLFLIFPNFVSFQNSDGRGPALPLFPSGSVHSESNHSRSNSSSSYFVIVCFGSRQTEGSHTILQWGFCICPRSINHTSYEACKKQETILRHISFRVSSPPPLPPIRGPTCFRSVPATARRRPGATDKQTDKQTNKQTTPPGRN